MSSRRRRTERGTTLFEVTLTMVLSVAVLGAVLGVFDSFVSADRAQRGVIDSRDQARGAMAALERDLRATSSFGSPPPGVAASESLVLGLSDGRTVRWWRPPAAASLQREVLDDAADVVAARTVLAEPDGAGLDVRYFLASGAEVPGATVKSGTALECVTRVSVELRVAGWSEDASASSISGEVAPRALESRSVTC